MTHRIICSVTLEPEDFFDDPIAPPGPQRAIAINLNYDFAPAGREPTPAEHVDARNGFDAFLRALPTAQFFAYRYDATATPALVSVPNLVSLRPIGVVPAGNAVAILGWLDKRVSDNRWASGNQKDIEVNRNDLSATHVLGTAANWNAPLPQDAGLTRILIAVFNGVPVTEGMIVLPSFGPDPLADPARVQVSVPVTPDGSTELDVEYDAGHPFDNVITAVRVLPKEAAPDPTSLVDDVTGFLKPRGDADNTHAALKRLRERSASQLSTSTQLVSLELPRKDNEPPSDDLRRALWRGVNGMLTLLDPLFVALTMQGTRTVGAAKVAPREGPFTNLLNACIIEMQRNVDARALSQVAVELIERVQKLLADVQARPNDMADLLAAMFELERPSDFEQEKESLLAGLLLVYEKQTPSTIDSVKIDGSPFNAGLDRRVVLELAKHGQTLQTEEGVEKALLTLLTHLRIDAGWLKSFAGLSDLTDENRADVFGRFRQFLAKNVNGADATRMVQGAMFEHYLVKHARASGAKNDWNVSNLETALATAEWFARRVKLVPSPATVAAFDELASRLPAVDPDYLPAGQKDDLHNLAETGKLDTAFLHARAQLLADTNKVRFLPDHAPKPLPVQIGVDQDTTDIDDFFLHYNGVAVLVRRQFKGKALGAWAQVNDAWLKEYDWSDFRKDRTIHPLLPVAVDGQRNLFFEYDGHPLASDDFSKTKPDNGSDKDPVTPFYEVDSPDVPNWLPALAYGADYEIAAHVVSKGGALPRALRVSRDEPWRPVQSVAADLPTDSLGNSVVTRTAYLRTTAIGRVAAGEASAAAQTQRFGAAIEGVQPLSHDYPRLGLAAEAGTVASLDVLRNGDGSGSITLPGRGERASVLKLADLMWWKGGGRVRISILRDATAGPDAQGIVPDPWVFTTTSSFAGGTLELIIETDGAAVPNGKHTCSWSAANGLTLDKEPPNPTFPIVEDPTRADDLGAVWVRIEIVADAGSPIAVSFAEPNASAGRHVASRPAAEGLLLLAPGEEAKTWRNDIPSTATATINLPCVGFNDLDRWLNNPDLCETARGGCATHEFGKFREELMTAYLGRMLSPKLASIVDGLPDPAVDRILVEVTPLDGLRNDPVELAKVYCGAFAEVNIEPLGDQTTDASGGSTMSRLAKLLANYTRELTIHCTGKASNFDAKVDGAKVTVKIPSGLAGRVTIRPMVPGALFDGPKPVLDKRLLQHAVGKRGDHYVFPGYATKIEGLLSELVSLDSGNGDRPWLATKQKWADAANRIVAVRPAGRARSYDLVAAHARVITERDDMNWRWRLLGSIDVHTQRWRFNGQPIYTWISPKPTDARSVEPALQIKASLLPKLDQFEAEAFAGRDDLDADTKQARLQPGPADSVLQTVPWEPPSATMFRHRLTLRSRYAPALSQPTHGEAEAWGEDPWSEKRSPPGSAEAWLRAVMLADRTQIQLTRPQLRALIPMTVSPGKSGADSAAPPVLAILDEAPFVHGGLADRIGSEIRVGFGWALPENEPLQIQDARKEVGRDARLTYRPFDKMRAPALALQGEGPVGLTFDDDSAPAPTFANAALSLRPVLLDEEGALAGSLEEHFVSVGLRRYLDHRWLKDVPDRPADPAVAQAWWFVPDDALTIAVGGVDICIVQKKSNSWVVWFDTKAVDPMGPTQAVVQIATASTACVQSLAILHQPLEEGRASFSIFASPKASSEPGDNNLPLMLASLEWHVPAGGKVLKITGPHTVYPTSASPVTLMNWTRIGKRSDVLHSSVEGKPDALHIEAMEARRTGTQLTFKQRGDKAVRWLETEMSRYPHPLYVHRRLAVILTSQWPGIGRPVEVFDEVRGVTGNTVKTGNSVQVAPAKDLQTSVRVLEYEVPAFPVVANASTAVTGFDRAVFDLRAIVGDHPPWPKMAGVSLHIRPLGGETANRTVDTLVLRLTFVPRPSNADLIAALKPEDVTLRIVRSSPSALLRFITLSMWGSQRSAIAVFEGGEERACTIEPPPTSPVDIQETDIRNWERIEVTALQYQTGSRPFQGEFWSDLSLLTIRQDPEDGAASLGDFSRFAFDWMFTGTTAEASDAISEVGLKGVPEAEARIVSISPPLPVVEAG